MSAMAETRVSREVREVVHLSATPLVGAPGKIAAACTRLGVRSIAIQHSDYPGALAGLFSRSAFTWKDAPSGIHRASEERLQNADIVHVHNDIPPNMIEWALQHARTADFIYQVHSPLREGPLYLDRAGPMGINFAQRLVVGQYHPRHWQDHRPVPNIVDALPTMREYRAGERLRVMFTPSHSRDGRWNAKTNNEVTATFEGLVKTKLVDIVTLEKPLPPEQLLELRRSCHVTVDEVITGSHHQVSLEGLCAGNVVINGADFFSLAMACSATGATTPPPFVKANSSNLADTLMQLAMNPQQTAALQRASYAYYEAWLMPDRLGQIFLDIYQEARNA